MILYGFIMYLIFISSTKKRSFDSSFYWIFGFSAINNIFHAISYYFTFRLTRIPLLYSWLATWPSESIYYVIIYTIMCYSASALRIYNFVLSFNRVTIFLLKSKHVSFWKQNLKYILAGCVLGPIIFVWNFPFLGIQNIPMEGWVVFIGPTITDFVPWWERAQNLFILILVTSIAELLMNFYFIYGVFKWRYSVTSANHHSSVTKENKMMFLYSMLVFFTEALSCIQQVSISVFRIPPSLLNPSVRARSHLDLVYRKPEETRNQILIDNNFSV